MSISDELMWRYIDLLSFRDASEIQQWKDDVAGGQNPMNVKKNFAIEIVARFHSGEESVGACQNFDDFKFSCRL